MAEQLPLPYIPHSLEGEVVTQRQKDGYINATAMCKAAGKNWADYYRLGGTKAYLDELSADVGIPISTLIQSFRGTPASLQGTWVHPQIAINLAQWLSPKFAVRVSKWVFDWLSSGGYTKPGTLPYHLRRYVSNQQNVPPGHFSVLNEITLALVAPLEIYGYTLPERLWPDISQGLMFARWLREEKGVDTNQMPTYLHVFEDGRRPVQAKAYPNDFLADFRLHFHNVWLPLRAREYFRGKDPAALTHLPRLLPAPTPAEV